MSTQHKPLKNALLAMQQMALSDEDKAVVQTAIEEYEELEAKAKAWNGIPVEVRQFEQEHKYNKIGRYLEMLFNEDPTAFIMYDVAVDGLGCLTIENVEQLIEYGEQQETKQCED